LAAIRAAKSLGQRTLTSPGYGRLYPANLLDNLGHTGRAVELFRRAAGSAPGTTLALEKRVARLLQPLAGAPQDRMPTTVQVAFLLTFALIVAIALGAVYGERLVGPLLAFS
jgi:hypothetical protein